VNPAFVSPNTSTLLLYAVSLVLVMWTVVDVARRPSSALSPRSKVAWIIGSVVGWLLLGIVGAFVAAVYLVGPRRRMNSQRW
jgi:hypothetical protein